MTTLIAGKFQCPQTAPFGHGSEFVSESEVK